MSVRPSGCMSVRPSGCMSIRPSVSLLNLTISKCCSIEAVVYECFYFAATAVVACNCCY